MGVRQVHRQIAGDRRVWMQKSRVGGIQRWRPEVADCCLPLLPHLCQTSLVAHDILSRPRTPPNTAPGQPLPINWSWHMLWNLFATAVSLQVGKLRSTLGKELIQELTAKSQIHPRNMAGDVSGKRCGEGTGMRQELSARVPTS